MEFKSVLNEKFAEEYVEEIDMPGLKRQFEIVSIIGFLLIVCVNVYNFRIYGESVRNVLFLLGFSIIAYALSVCFSFLLLRKKKRELIKEVMDVIQNKYHASVVEADWVINDTSFIRNDEDGIKIYDFNKMIRLHETTNYFIVVFEDNSYITILKNSIKGVSENDLKTVLVNQCKNR